MLILKGPICFSFLFLQVAQSAVYTHRIWSRPYVEQGIEPYVRGHEPLVLTTTLLNRFCDPAWNRTRATLAKRGGATIAPQDRARTGSRTPPSGVKTLSSTDKLYALDPPAVFLLGEGLGVNL